MASAEDGEHRKMAIKARLKSSAREYSIVAVDCSSDFFLYLFQSDSFSPLIVRQGPAIELKKILSARQNFEKPWSKNL